MGRKHHKRNRPNTNKEEFDMSNNQNQLAIPERGFFGKAKDVLTSDTAVGIYKGVGIFAAGVATGVGALMFADRKSSDSVCTDGNFDE